MKSSLCTLALLTLTACGGGGAGEEESFVTFMHEMPEDDGTPTNALAESLDAMNRRISERGVAAVRVQCGTWSVDTRKPRGAEIGPIGSIYPSWLVYYTFHRSDAERIGDLPWYRTVDDDWRNTYVDPGECPNFAATGEAAND